MSSSELSHGIVLSGVHKRRKHLTQPAPNSHAASSSFHAGCHRAPTPQLRTRAVQMVALFPPTCATSRGDIVEHSASIPSAHPSDPGCVVLRLGGTSGRHPKHFEISQWCTAFQ